MWRVPSRVPPLIDGQVQSEAGRVPPLIDGQVPSEVGPRPNVFDSWMIIYEKVVNKNRKLLLRSRVPCRVPPLIDGQVPSRVHPL